jgi:hypothetical protein
MLSHIAFARHTGIFAHKPPPYRRAGQTLYLERKQSEGKTRREAIRCLKRQLARTVYTTLKSEPLLT